MDEAAEDRSPSYELNISRIFAAPRDAVYRAFAGADLLAEWLIPSGWSMHSDQIEIDAQPGGGLRYEFVNADDPGQRMTTSAQFGVVVPDELLTWTEVTAGDPAAGYSAYTTRVELHEEPGSKTRLELRQGPYTEAGETDAREWWNGAFSRLDSLLELGDGRAV
jgi:uncharacterized protein YndB with AHSA1/START domain